MRPSPNWIAHRVPCHVGQTPAVSIRHWQQNPCPTLQVSMSPSSQRQERAPSTASGSFGLPAGTWSPWSLPFSSVSLLVRDQDLTRLDSYSLSYSLRVRPVRYLRTPLIVYLAWSQSM